jgi:hypothetical protein
LFCACKVEEIDGRLCKYMLLPCIGAVLSFFTVNLGFSLLCFSSILLYLYSGLVLGCFFDLAFDFGLTGV